MRISILFISIILWASSAHARDVQLFNPDIFGQPTSTAVKLLIDKKSDEIEPYMVSTDIRCGKYYAASIFYRGKATFEEIRASINKNYKTYEKVSLLKEPMQAKWRVEDKKFTISISQEADATFRVSFIQFLPTKEIFKALMRVEGGDAKAIDAMDEDDCKDGSQW
jgi:hypothetical protein